MVPFNPMCSKCYIRPQKQDVFVIHRCPWLQQFLKGIHHTALHSNLVSSPWYQWNLHSMFGNYATIISLIFAPRLQAGWMNMYIQISRQSKYYITPLTSRFNVISLYIWRDYEHVIVWLTCRVPSLSIFPSNISICKQTERCINKKTFVKHWCPSNKETNKTFSSTSFQGHNIIGVIWNV